MSLQYFLASLLFVGISMALIMRLVLDKYVLSPLASLRDGARKIRASGDLSTRIAVSGKDELADLGHQFNDMIEALGLTQVQLRAARDLAQAATDAKSSFLANMSHEIRTPMTAILGFADLLLEPDLTDADRREQVQIIRRNGAHLLAIINDILDVSKIEAGRLTIEKVRCEPLRIAHEVVSLLRGKASEKGLQFSIETAGPIPSIMDSDPTRLRQILMNLLGNAIKFTERGSVKLVIRCTANGAQAAATSPSLMFEVIDTGIGMNPEQIEHLFTPFTQADDSTTRRFGGTGLGLSISRRLAQMLGGGISVVSEHGNGSTFTCWVPTGSLSGVDMLTLQNEAEIDRHFRATGPSSTQEISTFADLTGMRILLAEDGADNQRLISFILRRAGAQVTLADNGRTACQLAMKSQSSGESFDVILMDMQMPELDGYGAAKQLRSKGYTNPIIALTAHAMADDRNKCLLAGCDDYASKPIDRARLLAMLLGHKPATGSRATALRASA
jgi:signal transduction histidine kinase/AmiR/NasT family two-component response regulator